MHELALAESIAAVATAHAAGRRVRRVYVRVGALRQVVPSALRFSFELVAAARGLGGAALEIDCVGAAGTCRTCGADNEWVNFPLGCAQCGSLAVTVTRGEELLVEALDIDDDEAAPARPSGVAAEWRQTQ